MSGVMNQVQPTSEAIEEAIREAYHDVMKRTVPAARIYRRSVSYWDEELSVLRIERIRAKRYVDGPQQQGESYSRAYRTADNTFKRRIK